MGYPCTNSLLGEKGFECIHASGCGGDFIFLFLSLLPLPQIYNCFLVVDGSSRIFLC